MRGRCAWAGRALPPRLSRQPPSFDGFGGRLLVATPYTVRRGPALGGFFTEAPDTSPLRRPSAAPTRFTFASRPLAVGQSYAARQAA